MVDTDGLAERILKDLDHIFTKDPLINDVSIIKIEFQNNSGPVIHLNHQVEIESWCIKHVFQYAYRKLMEYRKNKMPGMTKNLLDWSRAVLFINPDVQIAWNIRKELISSQKQGIEDELTFSALVLSCNPKSGDVFVHRRWLLNKTLEESGASVLPHALLNIEFLFCTKAAEAQNHYAWIHRIWIIKKALPTCQEVYYTFFSKWDQSKS